MERVFSQHDLINKELDYIEWRNRSKGFFKSLFESMIYTPRQRYEFTTHVPTYLVLRAETLCNFIQEEFEVVFSISELMWITYKEFLSYAYRKKDNYQIYEMLKNRDMSNIEVFSYGELEETYDIMQRNKGNKTRLYISLDKKEALMGETILSDLYDVYEHDWNLEDVIRIMFVDFIKEYNKGNLPNAVKNIVDFYKKRIATEE